MSLSSPLTEFQKSIWRGQLLHKDAPLYNMIFTFEIKGPLDKKLFQQSFAYLVKTTDSLRAIVDDQDMEIPAQRITDQEAFLDLLAFDLESEEYKKWLDEKNKINFNLKACSYYSALIELGEGHFVWYINQHHLFCDAYVFQILLDRLSDIYVQLKSKHEPEVENVPLRVQEGLNPKASVDSEIRETVDSTSLSLYAQDAINFRETKAGRIALELPENFEEDIRKKISDLQLSTFAPNLDLLSFLMSTLLILLKQIGNGKESLQISNIFSTRVSSGDKKSFHPFLQIHDSNIDLTDGSSFTEVYSLVRAFLISQSSDESIRNAAPAIISNMFHLEMSDFAGFETTHKWHHCDHIDHHHFLRFHIFKYKSQGKLNIAFDLKEEFFHNGIEEKFARDYLGLIKTLCETNSDDLIDEVCLVGDQEMEKLNNDIGSLSNTTLSSDTLVLNTIAEVMELNKNNTALYFNDEVISYGMLMLSANNISAYLKENGIDGDKKVVLYLPRSPQYIYALLGVLNTGNSFVPVPSSYPIERLKLIANEVEADLILHMEDELDTEKTQLDLRVLDLMNESNRTRSNVYNKVFYTLFTSGSTGKPKGVTIGHQSFSNYINGIKDQYLPSNTAYHMPLFTSIGFDLTMTSVFLPLATGGSISIYPEGKGIDLSIRDIIKDEKINCYKCTPSHLKVIAGESVQENVKSIIVGGENFTRQSCLRLYHQYNGNISIINEYGPTEATVGCIAYFFNPDEYHGHLDVVIGKPLNNHFAFISNSSGVPLPNGAVGELCIGGKGLAESYLNNPEQTASRFVEGNKFVNARYYRTGDLAKINNKGDFEFLGRNDDQLSVGGIRIEKGEIENVLKQHNAINECIVLYPPKSLVSYSEEYIHCVKCGLPSNYPEAEFNDDHVCRYCQSYDTYSAKVEKYFKTPDDFKEILDSTQANDKEYDCLMLFSGGKDSSYALGRIVKLGYKVLAFTLDNGYISDSAKQNIERITSTLGVDHVFGESPHMNEIFVDSLKTHCNVCNGCFKTIYNLSLQIAFEKNIPVIVTGLTRGQFFETKLSEEIFWKPMENADEIDQILFDARKAYHNVQDIAYQRTNGERIVSEGILDKVRIVDFYRYHDVTLEELLNFINTKLPWVRPEDTGRSTNCLINQVGIHIHKEKKGYSNYAFPYSWDVRTGHKTKEEAIHEIEEPIVESEVMRIINEIGYEEDDSERKLAVYYTGNFSSGSDLRSFIGKFLPEHMIPSSFIHLDQIPLTSNGKVDKVKLLEYKNESIARPIVQPETEIEAFLLPIWQEVISEAVKSIDDDFFELGGTSLDAIRICSRIEKSIGYRLQVNYIFEKLTVSRLAAHIEEDMRSQMQNN